MVIDMILDQIQSVTIECLENGMEKDDAGILD